MSSFAFSHQFSQRWLATPAPVKQTIIQELDDIVTLLQPDTDLERYQFSTPNLHTHIEDLIAIEHQRLAQIEADERQKQREEQERMAQQAEQQRQEQEKLEQAQTQEAQQERQRQEAERLAQDREAIEQLEKERVTARQAFQQAQGTNHPAINIVTTSPNVAVTNTPSDAQHNAIVYAVSHPTINNEHQDIDIAAIKAQIIADLQTQLHKYLDDIKTDITGWLDDEVDKQLTERLNPPN